MRVLKELASLMASVIIGIVAALFITLFLFQPTYVEGTSMEPTLHDKDKIIINKLTATFNQEPKYGDIVVVDSHIRNSHTLKDDLSYNIRHNLFARIWLDPGDDNYWIKRVIGKAGDTIVIKDGKVYRNGEEISEAYIKGDATYPDNRFVVPENYVFVMGDNRKVSKDSRQIGCIPLSHVLGKYQMKF